MPRDRLRLTLLPWLVGGVALALAGWLWRHELGNHERALKADFDFSVRQTASRVESRIAAYEQMLRGVQGLCQAVGAPQRAQFEAYVDTLLAGADFAGVQFFGHLARTGPGTEGAVEARFQFVAPATGLNLQLLDKDAHTNVALRAALEVARDSSGVGITMRLPDLFGAAEQNQPSFMMFLPLYAPGLPVDGVEARRAALVGWVAAGVRMKDLMSSLYGEVVPGIDVRVHDGVEAEPRTLMYEVGSARSGAARPRFEALEYIGVAGHTWTLAVSAGPAFEQRAGGDAAQIILWSGLGGALLLALLTHLLVSGRQRSLETARAMTQDLRASEDRYRRIVETADEGIWVTDERGRTAFVNPKLEQMLGQSGPELNGRPLSEFLHDSGTDGGVLDRVDQPQGSGRPRELKFRRKDGSVLWASVATSPILDAAGRPGGALSMVTDITARKRADAARAELEAQLRESQKMEAIGTLAGGIAHDFNNILAAILGNVALTQERAAHDPALLASLDQIGKGAVRARSLVQQILAFSRRQPHRLVGLLLRPVVEESLNLLRPLLPASASLVPKLADAPLHVLADATQLQQVVMNLCTNAWHALDGRPGSITVGLDAVYLDAETAARLGTKAGAHARLWVADTGVGMDEATRARVFEPFFTTKPVGRGTGLGLSVVHGIVASHGGAITVASQAGEGSRFDLYLPLLPQAEPAPVTPAADRAGPGTAGRHVVYIDDDPVMMVMVQALLQRAGYRVSAYGDPRQALEALRAEAEDVDIVVTDYNMPGLSGLDLAGELARLRPDLPVVISSGFVSEEMSAAAARAGVRSVLQKEYTLERLVGIVHAVLGGEATPVH